MAGCQVDGANLWRRKLKKSDTINFITKTGGFKITAGLNENLDQRWRWDSLTDNVLIYQSLYLWATPAGQNAGRLGAGIDVGERNKQKKSEEGVQLSCPPQSLPSGPLAEGEGRDVRSTSRPKVPDIRFRLRWACLPTSPQSCSLSSPPHALTRFTSVQAGAVESAAPRLAHTR